jgi:hypothetical protein
MEPFLYNGNMPPRYRYPAGISLAILRDFASGRKRSFAQDSIALARGIRELRVVGAPPSDPAGRLFLVNHYSRPGFRAWWIVIALVSLVRADMHWTMTSAWTYPDFLQSHFLTPITQWMLARIARLYGFTLMPPMPPRAEDAPRRADSVRRVIRLARGGRPAIGLAPEGMDSPDGALMQPPAGVGRFIAHLAEAGYTLLPVGVYEEDDALCVRFGGPFTLPPGRSTIAVEKDRECSTFVMCRIGELLPERLRGIYN